MWTSCYICLISCTWKETIFELQGRRSFKINQFFWNLCSLGLYTTGFFQVDTWTWKSLNTRVMVLSFGFVPSSKIPELHILMVIAKKRLLLNLTTWPISPSQQVWSPFRTSTLISTFRKLSPLQCRNLDCFLLCCPYNRVVTLSQEKWGLWIWNS